MKPSEFLKTHEWTQGCWARDKHGREVGTSNPKACSFCLAGALIAVAPFPQAVEWAEKVDQALFRVGLECDLVTWNDEPGRTKDEVVKLLEDCGL